MFMYGFFERFVVGLCRVLRGLLWKPGLRKGLGFRDFEGCMILENGCAGSAGGFTLNPRPETREP